MTMALAIRDVVLVVLEIGESENTGASVSIRAIYKTKLM